MRLALAPEADAFALRGGMLVRSWMPASGRRIRDADLVCDVSFRPRELRAVLRAILANRAVEDGIVFDAERFRVDTAAPNAKLFAAGEVDGELAEMTVDFTFGLDVWPAASRCTLAMTRGAARLNVCRHEMVIATKLGVIAELGVREWRPKDLADIWLALRRFGPTRSTAEAIERRAASVHELDAPWWRGPRAHMRWDRFAVRHPALPRHLDAVLAEVRANLSRQR